MLMARRGGDPWVRPPQVTQLPEIPASFMSRAVWRVALIFLPMAVLIACEDPACVETPTNPCDEGPAGSISGSVLDNGHPLFGVTVTLSGRADTTGTTDGNGNFSFSGMRNGDYTVAVTGQPGSCQDGQGFSRDVTVASGGAAAADFDLNCSTSWTQISAGRGTCGIRSTGLGYCWGRGTLGALGNGLMADVANPSAVASTAQFFQIEQIFNATCGLTSSGGFCWGQNTDGGLGIGSTTDTNVPTPIQTGATFSELGDGGCAIDNGGVGYCWGLNDRGQLGDGTTESRTVPTPVSGGLSFTEIGSGERHACGIAGSTWCWGDNQRGQLGQGNSGAPALTPVEVPTGPNFTQLTVGREFNCGLTSGGQIWCWGRNIDGQIGVAPSGQVEQPTQVGSSSNWTAVTAGSFHVCGLQGTTAYCWGAGDQGQLGNGTFESTFTPTPVANGLAFSQIDAGSEHTCGLVGGVAYCWGKNENGEIGDGTESVRAVPTQVMPGS